VNPFTYTKAGDPADALRRGAAEGARYLGGGTNLIDLMRETIERPSALIDVTGLSGDIVGTPDGGLLIGAAARNTAVAEHQAVRTRYPVLTRAIVAGASAQIRNMATVGGNLMQRTRCPYFYDPDGSRCNKRTPGEGCDAIDGFSRSHAILGASPACAATHPSDMCVALAALGAVVHLRGAVGTRSIPLTEFHRLPEDHPEIETVLKPGELITAVEVPPLPFAARSAYRKVRDRATWTAVQSGTCGSRSAASRPSPGARGGPKRRSAAVRPHRRASARQPRPNSPPPGRCATTNSRLISPNGPSRLCSVN
jgi:xanthine dehydrogenase YagS FAD-binding subunit